jgi:glutamine synthetase type III
LKGEERVLRKIGASQVVFCLETAGFGRRVPVFFDESLLCQDPARGQGATDHRLGCLTGRVTMTSVPLPRVLCTSISPP